MSLYLDPTVLVKQMAWASIQEHGINPPVILEAVYPIVTLVWLNLLPVTCFYWIIEYFAIALYSAIFLRFSLLPVTSISTVPTITVLQKRCSMTNMGRYIQSKCGTINSIMFLLKTIAVFIISIICKWYYVSLSWYFCPWIIGRVWDMCLVMKTY